MQSIFSNALSRAVAKHIDLSVTRRETLSWLTLLIMQHGTICLWRLAAYVASMAQTDSVRRRFYRFFQFVRLDSTLAARVVVELLGLGGKPWVLAIDRTNWDFGKTTINILMISVTWNGMGIPLLWMLLPTAGNSHTSERTELLDRLRAAFPDMKIAALMGDREFIGDAWMAYLQRQNIPFILRLRENQHVLRESYAAMSIAAIARHLRIGERMIVKGCCRLGRHDETLSSPVRLVVMPACLRRTAGLGLFRQRAACARPLSSTLDHRNHVRQSQDQGLRAGGHAPDRPRQTLHLARAARLRRGAHRQNWRRHGALASHSCQKPWSPRALAVRSRSPHTAQNLCRSKSRSNSRLPRPTPVPKTPHQTLASFGLSIASRVRCCWAQVAFGREKIGSVDWQARKLAQ